MRQEVWEMSDGLRKWDSQFFFIFFIFLKINSSEQHTVQQMLSTSFNYFLPPVSIHLDNYDHRAINGQTFYSSCYLWEKIKFVFIINNNSICIILILIRASFDEHLSDFGSQTIILCPWPRELPCGGWSQTFLREKWVKSITSLV